MALWKLEQLKRWWEQKQRGKDDDEGEPQDSDDGDDEGAGSDEGDDAPQDGDEGADDEGGGDEGEGDDEGSDGDEGGNPDGGGDEGEGEGKGDDDGDGGDEGEGDDDGEGGDAQGNAPGRLNPADFEHLEKLTNDDIRDPNVHVENEAGESSTPTGDDVAKPVIIIDPHVVEVPKPSPTSGDYSNREWLKTLKGIRAATLRLALRRIMQRSDYSEREGGLRSGRLSGRGINRMLNGSVNVFERRHEQDGENVAVSLLIDKSGSMAGAEMRAAADTALLLAETAQNAGAQVEVIAFDSTYSGEKGKLEEALAKDTGTSVAVGRHEEQWLLGDASQVYVIKSFANHIGHLRRMYVTMRSMASGGTHDASALKWAGERLLRQPAERKILFVIADGAGDSAAVFRHVVTELEKKDVIVIGVGIGCGRWFNDRFTHAAVISDVNELCSKTFGLLIGAIARARGL
jgi:cobalamin biosynthesis protein CobT